MAAECRGRGIELRSLRRPPAPRMFAMFERRHQKVELSCSHHAWNTIASMAPSRACISSATVLRAVSRPSNPRFPLAHRLPYQCLRCYASSNRKRYYPPRRPRIEPPSDIDLGGAPGTTPGGKGRLESMEWWERDDLGNERLIEKIANKSDIERIQEMDRKAEEFSDLVDAEEEKMDSDSDYNIDPVYGASIDILMKHHNFQDLRPQLEIMKRGIEWQKNMEKEDEKGEVEILHGVFQEMIDDPDIGDAKEELLDLQARILKLENGPEDSPELVELFERLGDKLDKNKVYSEKWEKKVRDAGLDPNDPEKIPDDFLSSEEELEKANPPRWNEFLELEDAMKVVWGRVSQEMGVPARANPSEGLTEEQEAEVTSTFETLANDIAKFKDAPPEEDFDESKISPELTAQIDKILDDPALFDKLRVIKQAIAQAKSDYTRMGKSALDPALMDESELTTLKEQIKIAENDPEHLAALRRLRINLLPPFNIHPAIRQLNYALKLAYVGGNDDVRRILWRAYLKARGIPSLLEGIPDDAWDILWYSQAVTWETNQNRETHLKILLADLRSTGRDGPPTHPEDAAAMYD
ncbi:hypothetical protein CC78DRAFT_566918 [Lojkania enalia]|uniref:Uncharacterized protein n=1 Tax=Lojkania enalia TaxID=147567 RepID=A0A9P4KCV8_9PLEO|nr:hypothetical protein CC78DRAFT_566918 [Didymosphaeria enalia]